MGSEHYPKTAVNSIKRLGNRGAYDYATVHTIINTAPILHVSFNDPEHPFPVVLPMLGCTADFSNQGADPSTSSQDIYIHGYVSGRIFKSGKNATGEGLPITVAASYVPPPDDAQSKILWASYGCGMLMCNRHIDGLVLSLTPFHNSCNYRSAIAYGYATLVTDEAEALYAMTKITDNMLPSRWEKSRIPPTKAELQSTSILHVKIASASAKVRVGGPSEDRADLKNSELRKSVWTGVVPVWYQWGEPVPGKENGVEDVESYIERWRLQENQKGKALAYEAIQKDK